MIQNFRKEGNLLAKIKKILTFDEILSPQLHEELLKSHQSNRITSKMTSLAIIYQNLSNHQNFLADYLVLYFGVILDNFKFLKNLDYRRVLYVKKQIGKCKRLLLVNIKENYPSVYKKFLLVIKNKINEKKVKKMKIELISRDIEDFGDILQKRVKVN